MICLGRNTSTLSLHVPPLLIPLILRLIFTYLISFPPSDGIISSSAIYNNLYSMQNLPNTSNLFSVPQFHSDIDNLSGIHTGVITSLSSRQRINVTPHRIRWFVFCYTLMLQWIFVSLTASCALYAML